MTTLLANKQLARRQNRSSKTRRDFITQIHIGVERRVGLSPKLNHPTANGLHTNIMANHRPVGVQE